MRGDTVQHSQKMTVTVTIHDFTARRWLKGAGRQHLSLKALKIYLQISFYGRIFGGTVKFEFKFAYKLCVAI